MVMKCLRSESGVKLSGNEAKETMKGRWCNSAGSTRYCSWRSVISKLEMISERSERNIAATSRLARSETKSVGSRGRAAR